MYIHVHIFSELYVHVYTLYVHVYTMYVHGFTSCLSRFPEDGEFVQMCLYCVHTYINTHERVGTMYIQIYYIMNMYVYPLFPII